MGGVTTVKNNYFPEEDISHKPRRMQGDAIRQAEALRADEDSGVSASVSVPLGVDTNMTLEQSIEFYEKNAEKFNMTLYANTARWLRAYLRIPAKDRAMLEASTTPTLVVNVSEL